MPGELFGPEIELRALSSLGRRTWAGVRLAKSFFAQLLLSGGVAAKALAARPLDGAEAGQVGAREDALADEVIAAPAGRRLF